MMQAKEQFFFIEPYPYPWLTENDGKSAMQEHNYAIGPCRLIEADHTLNNVRK